MTKKSFLGSMATIFVAHRPLLKNSLYRHIFLIHVCIGYITIRQYSALLWCLFCFSLVSSALHHFAPPPFKKEGILLCKGHVDLLYHAQQLGATENSSMLCPGNLVGRKFLSKKSQIFRSVGKKWMSMVMLISHTLWKLNSRTFFSRNFKLSR